MSGSEPRNNRTLGQVQMSLGNSLRTRRRRLRSRLAFATNLTRSSKSRRDSHSASAGVSPVDAVQREEIPVIWTLTPRNFSRRAVCQSPSGAFQILIPIRSQTRVHAVFSFRVLGLRCVADTLRLCARIEVAAETSSDSSEEFLLRRELPRRVRENPQGSPGRMLAAGKP